MDGSDFDAVRDDVRLLNQMRRGSRYDTKNRTWLLAIHAIGGLAIGACFFRFGVPLGWRNAFGDDPLAHFLVSVAPVLGGLTLGLGLAGGRRVLLEAIGMAALFGWELVGVGIVCYWLIGDPPGPLHYQIVLYALPAALMGVHLATLVAYVVDGYADRKAAL